MKVWEGGREPYGRADGLGILAAVRVFMGHAGEILFALSILFGEFPVQCKCQRRAIWETNKWECKGEREQDYHCVTRLHS